MSCAESATTNRLCLPCLAVLLCQTQRPRGLCGDIVSEIENGKQIEGKMQDAGLKDNGIWKEWRCDGQNVEVTVSCAAVPILYSSST